MPLPRAAILSDRDRRCQNPFVSQKTVVYRVPSAEHRALRDRLPPEDFEFRQVPHAVFSAKGQGVVATLYRSGKLVVQGPDPELFAGRFLARGAAGSAPTPVPARKPSKPASDALRDPASVQGVRIGSDECGKGDFFGPLVVCAVRVDADRWRALALGRVADSKTFSDRAARELGAALRSNVTHALRVLDPPDYNRRWAEVRNVNELLADLHAEAIAELAEPGAHVVVDRFANESLISKRLAHLDIELEQRPRAEDDPAVAAASLIARDEFLERIAALSEEVAVELHKGAGEPTDRAARAFVALHGAAALGRVAKLHFKNAARVLPR